MLPLSTASLFFTTCILLALAPGPDNIFVLAQSAQHGRKAGIFVTMGLCTGVLLHTAAVTFGVAVIFQTSPIAFDLLRYGGAVYLFYLAWKSFTDIDERQGGKSVRQQGSGALYVRGVIMNVTNPKVSIFFLAFLPQFVHPEHGPVFWQMLQLGGLFVLSTILIFGSIALLAGSFGTLLVKSPQATRLLNCTAATIFICLGARLLLLQ